MKFLVDECLSPKLVELAHAQGHGQSSHIVWLGRAGAKDWALIPVIVEGDWTFVTRNSADFRGSAGHPGDRGLYASLALHAGLVCLNGPDGMARGLQRDLFGLALAELAARPDLVNQVLEVSLEADGTVRLARYQLPAS